MGNPLAIRRCRFVLFAPTLLIHFRLTRSYLQWLCMLCAHCVCWVSAVCRLFVYIDLRPKLSQENLSGACLFGFPVANSEARFFKFYISRETCNSFFSSMFPSCFRTAFDRNCFAECVDPLQSTLWRRFFHGKVTLPECTFFLSRRLLAAACLTRVARYFHRVFFKQRPPRKRSRTLITVLSQVILPVSYISNYEIPLLRQCSLPDE